MNPDDPLLELVDIYNKYTKYIRICIPICAILLIASIISHLLEYSKTGNWLMILAAVSLGLAGVCMMSRRDIKTHLEVWGYPNLLDSNRK